jgi:hypothetical protein
VSNSIYRHRHRPELLARFRHVEQEAVAAVAALLRAGTGLHAARPDQSARFVVATIESLTHRFTGHDPQIMASDLVALIVSVILKYPRWA